MDAVGGHLYKGGYTKGCPVLSLFDFTSDAGSVKKGEKGKIIGGSTMDNHDFRCEFPNIPELNVTVEKVTLVGKYTVGCPVISLIDFTHATGSVKKGEKGKIIGGPTMDKHDFRCEFPNIPELNVTVGKVTLVGNYTVGCPVISLIDFTHATGSVKKGEKGKIIGGPTMDNHDFRCEFPSIPELNVTVGKVTLVGNYTVGCPVISLIDFTHATGSVKKGEKGKIIGGPTRDNHDFRCEFPNIPELNVRADDVSLVSADPSLQESHVARVVDVDVAPAVLAPIWGVRDMPLIGIMDTTHGLFTQFAGLRNFVLAAIDFANDREFMHGPDVHGLTPDMIAAIWLYTSQILYQPLNEALRSEDREKVKPYFSYLRLLLAALDGLPNYSGTVYRGIKADLSDTYVVGREVPIWAFQSTTTDGDVLQNDMLLGSSGTRSLLSIHITAGKDICAYSAYDSEREILIPPGHKFKITNSMKVPGAGDLKLYDMQQLGDSALA